MPTLCTFAAWAELATASAGCFDFSNWLPQTDLLRLLDYTRNQDKTEHQLYVAGFNCDPAKCTRCHGGNQAALGKDNLALRIRQCFAENAPMPAALHEIAMKLYRQYLVVGGMPECVLQFSQTQDYVLVRHTQDSILTGYLNDMSKYNTANENKKTRLTYNNITVQLSKKNTRFQYKLLKKGARAAEFENAIEWLCLSGITNRVYKAEQSRKPLENYRDVDAFKIYVSDLGLLCAKKDLVANDVLYMVSELNDFKGGMTENYVQTQLIANGYQTYYWESDRGAEIDFVIQREGELIPIEVKSADNTQAKSLKVYMETYYPAYAIKLSAKNFGFDDNKKIVPLYAAFCV